MKYWVEREIDWDESPDYELDGLNFDKVLGEGNKPTEQQLDIVYAYSDGDSLCVEARAGAAKTSTSLLLAESDPDKRILYLAFNRHVIEEARAYQALIDDFNINGDFVESQA